LEAEGKAPRKLGEKKTYVVNPMPTGVERSSRGCEPGQ